MRIDATVLSRAMRPVLHVFAVAGAIAASGSALAIGSNTLVADIRGAQVESPVETDAFGCGRFVIDRQQNTLSYYIVFTGLSSDETAAHIHLAEPGVSGGVVHPLPAGSPKVGVWDYDEDLEDDILSGQTYVNIHSTNHPAGEIRGQIGAFVSVINGAQAATDSEGAGWGTFAIDTETNKLIYYIAYEDLSTPETAAHIHGFALHTEATGVLHGLPAGSPKVGVWNYSDAQEEAILQGRTYVNIHSEKHPGGEIRGQVSNIVAPIDGNQADVVTEAVGCAQIAIDPGTDELSYHIEYANLPTPETAAHIHGYAPPGTPAGVVHPLPAINPKLGVWNYPSDREADILSGLTYINIHTEDHPGGEIRGQIEFGSKQPCPADIDGDSSVGFGDLLTLLASWGPCPGGCAADLDGNEVVGFSDLIILLAAWGDCP